MNLIFRSNHAHPMRWKRRSLVKPKGEFSKKPKLSTTIRKFFKKRNL